MIISASRRTDIPAFYAAWFMNRVAAGYCEVPNPFNPAQISRVSLKPEDVEVIVFWTRHPLPLLPHLPELDRQGYRYYFQYTLLDNPSQLDPGMEAVRDRLDAFRELSDRIGPDRVIWRYDPIVLTAATGLSFHRATYSRLARELAGRTHRCVISRVKVYRKVLERLRELADDRFASPETAHPEMPELLRYIAETANENGMDVVSCASEEDLRPYGILPGKCVDDEYIRRIFGLRVTSRKDPSQRTACGCVVSRDIGMYDTCPRGCRYCYATNNAGRAIANHRRHDPAAPSLLG